MRLTRSDARSLARNQIQCINLIKNYETKILFRDYEKSAEIYPENKKPHRISLQAPNQISYEQAKIQIHEQFTVFSNEKESSLRESRTNKILPIEWFTLESAAEKKVYELLKNLGWTDKDVKL